MGKKSDEERIRAIERQLNGRFKAAEKQLDRMGKWRSISKEDCLKAVEAYGETEKEIKVLHKKLWPLLEKEGKRKAGKFARDFFSELEKVLRRGAVQPSAVVQPGK